MLFPTVQFAVFFAVVLTVSWALVKRPVAWKLFLLAASYLFYAAWDWRFTGLLAGCTVINQAAAIGIHRASTDRRRRWILGGAIAADLGVLAWFKYYGFFVSSFTNLLGRAGLEPSMPLFDILLPVGISFFTFQAMSYVIDVFRGKLEPAPHLDTAVFVAFFPQLVAGPIVRGSEMLPQLRSQPDAQRIEATRAFGLILAGLFKKVVIANTLATELVDSVFATPGAHSSMEILFGIYGYAVQIYADFSAYTDIAIGVALLLGFRFPQNFNAPYAATSLRDFWRRWHMTLSRWLRDYLYISLGGNRGGKLFTYRNLMITMVLGGLWHGAAWTFVLWGALHGGGLAIERFFSARREPRPSTTAGRITQRIVTFHVVCLGWVLFRADSLGTAGEVLTRLFTAGGPAPAVTPTILLLIAIGIGMQYVPRDLGTRLEVALGRWRPAAVAGTLGVSLLVLDALGPTGVAPFIYFQF
ncbi:MAG: MBOAT family protein [Nitriliruptorales bacterium]|nr:MBOAT family protein [Nitriliruptorales bacterium]